MSDKIEVSLPLQRNLNDVALELTLLAVKYIPIKTADDIENLYRKFHKAARDCYNRNY